MTNADKIRAMTDEELAHLLNTCVCPTKKCPKEFDDRCKMSDCEKCWRDWLKQEVSDNG